MHQNYCQITSPIYIIILAVLSYSVTVVLCVYNIVTVSASLLVVYHKVISGGGGGGGGGPWPPLTFSRLTHLLLP